MQVREGVSADVHFSWPVFDVESVVCQLSYPSVAHCIQFEVLIIYVSGLLAV